MHVLLEEVVQLRERLELLLGELREAQQLADATMPAAASYASSAPYCAVATTTCPSTEGTSSRGP
jgi:hypothetical protein